MVSKVLMKKETPKFNVPFVRWFQSGGATSYSSLDKVNRNPLIYSLRIEPLAETTQIDSAALHNVPQPTYLCNI